MLQNIVNCSLHNLRTFLEIANSKIAVATKQAANLPGLMIMVYAKIFMFRAFYLATNRAAAILLFKHPFIVVNSNSVLLEKNVMTARTFSLFSLGISSARLTSMIFSVLSFIVLLFGNFTTGLATIRKAITLSSVYGKFRKWLGNFAGIATFHLIIKCLTWLNFHTIEPEGITD